MATKKVVHAHGCTRCRARYEDVCATPDVSAACGDCQGRRGFALLIANRLPRDCCRAHSRLASKDDLTTYQLSRDCTWWICTVCARTQPHTNPTIDPNGDAP